MLLTSTNIYIKPFEHDQIIAVVSSRIMTMQESALGEKSHGPNRMYRKVIYENVPPDGSKRIFAQFFTLSMIIYGDEWRP